MSMTNDFENNVLNLLLRGETFTVPSAWYVGLFTTDPGEAGTGTEVSGGGYARVQATFTKATTGSSSNTADVVSPVSTAAWGTVTHFGIFDAVTSGRLLFKGTVTPNVPITGAGQQARFPAGSLVISLD
ncbi:hypothetical protein BK126_04395 [Paenibacillus sp. FSL H7-0326]|uniref:phage tail fiber protein n=1 Tax=Paenibacillus sp. FSL H7-0326 TaxID=1921144 RepID=UPI00096C594F|nr:hypothetical protein [Paenibacillus sp. FSL H7-0326]OMC71342.1 hypothetical protein BK126_04395 [Paenibacillus sp. FSL H7-0326]